MGDIYARLVKANIADGQGDVFTTEALQQAVRAFKEHHHLPVTVGFKAGAEIVGVVNEVTTNAEGLWIRGRFTKDGVTPESFAGCVFRIAGVVKASHEAEGCRVIDDVDILQVGIVPADQAVPLTKKENT